MYELITSPELNSTECLEDVLESTLQSGYTLPLFPIKQCHNTAQFYESYRWSNEILECATLII